MKLRVLLISLLLLAPLAPSISATPPKAGAICNKAGVTKNSKGKKYTCIKSGKKLVWNKGVAIKTPTPTPTPTSTPSVNQTPSPSPKKTADIRAVRERQLPLLESVFPSSVTQSPPSFSDSPGVYVGIPAASVGEPYRFVVSPKGGSHPPYFVNIGTGFLPPGIRLDNVTGVLSGTPVKPGTYRFTVGAIDTDYSDSNAFTNQRMGKYVNGGYANYELIVKGEEDFSKPWFAIDWSQEESAVPYPFFTYDRTAGGQASLYTVDGTRAVGLTALSNSFFNTSGMVTNNQSNKASMATIFMDSRWYTLRNNIKEQEGEENWTRSRIFFPHDYTPSGLFNGEWNVIQEWHTDEYTSYLNGLSIYLGVWSDKWDSNFKGTSANLILKLIGGETAPNGDRSKIVIDTASCRQKPGSLKLEHWYDIVIHMIWSTDPKKGLAEMWIDGERICSVKFPTLYRHSNGTTSWTTGLGFYNYRPMHDWSSTIYFGNFEIGPTAKSIGFKIP